MSEPTPAPLRSYTPWGLPYPTSVDTLDGTDWHIRELKWKANDLITNRTMVALSLAAATNSGGYIFIPTGLARVTGGVVMVQGPYTETRYLWSTFTGGGTTLDCRFYVPSTGSPAVNVNFWLKAIAWGTR